MNKILKIGAIAALAASATSAQATMVDVTFTGDNVVAAGGLCSDMNCISGLGWAGIGAVPNLNNWQVADSVTLDLGTGTHWFAWHVTNLGNGGSGNPASFLAEILWDGYANSSSSAWEVSTDNASSWVSATEFGANGGANIWTNVNGGPVAGISTSANWLWSQYNFQSEMYNQGWFRTSITIGEATQVPEPGTLALFGLGLLGAGFARRRKS